MKITKDDLKVFAMLAMFFGVLLLITNPVDLTNFPQQVTVGSASGMIIFFAGLLGFWYGAK
ncbi:hypothetical protein HZB89_00835 [archaeon]|nr:hypothetical protein [archaeon]